MTIQAKKKLESYFLIITKKLASKHLRVFFAINKSAYFGWLLLFNYSHQKSCYGVGNCLPLAYYRSYATRIEGNGKLCFISYDNVDGKLEYSNPNIGLFFNARGSYTLINDVPLFWVSIRK